MLIGKDKLFSYMVRVGYEASRSAWADFVRLRRKSAEFVLPEFERVDVSSSDVITADGRDVLRINGQAYALRQEIHIARMEKEFEAAKTAQTKTSTKSVVGTEGLSGMVCPKCGDSLQYSAVCGACAAGKAGYKHRYSCVHGHVDFVSKEKI